MGTIDWVFVLTLIVAVLQAVLAVLQARTQNKLNELQKTLDQRY